MSMGQCEKAVLLADCLELGKFKYASSQKANNKLNLDHLYEHPLHLRTVLTQLGNIALRFEPDLLVGVPAGGTVLADKLTDDGYVGVFTANLRKEVDEDGLKTFGYETDEDADLIMASSRIVVVEDVFNKLISTRGVLALPEIHKRAVGVVGVWDRGKHPARISADVPLEALVSQYIPNYLREKDKIYQYGVEV